MKNKEKEKYERVKDKKIEKKLDDENQKYWGEIEKIVKKLKEIQIKKCDNCNSKEKYLCENGDMECYNAIICTISDLFHHAIYQAFFIKRMIDGGVKIISPALNTGSMSPTNFYGDLAVTGEYNTIPKKGDVVLFLDNQRKEIIAHRIMGIDNGGIIITKGDATPIKDINKFDTLSAIQRFPCNSLIGKVEYIIKPNDKIYPYLTYRKKYKL